MRVGVGEKGWPGLFSVPGTRGRTKIGSLAASWRTLIRCFSESQFVPLGSGGGEGKGARVPGQGGGMRPWCDTEQHPTPLRGAC